VFKPERDYFISHKTVLTVFDESWESMSLSFGKWTINILSVIHYWIEQSKWLNIPSVLVLITITIIHYWMFNMNITLLWILSLVHYITKWSRFWQLIAFMIFIFVKSDWIWSKSSFHHHSWNNHQHIPIKADLDEVFYHSNDLAWWPETNVEMKSRKSCIDSTRNISWSKFRLFWSFVWCQMSI
jgi:hypothetical protein